MKTLLLDLLSASTHLKKITAIEQKILWGDFRSLEMQALGKTRLREYCEVGVS